MVLYLQLIILVKVWHVVRLLNTILLSGIPFNIHQEFSTSPHPTNKTLPDNPIELTTGLRPLGHLVGSANFASDFFDCRITNVKKNITSLLDNISNLQTCLHLFSQCIIQKLPHLLCSDMLFHFIYPLNTLIHPGKNGTAHSLPT